MNQNSVVGVHWSFWVIGWVGLIFNLIGCINYLSQMSPENVALMPDAYRAMVASRPAWGTGAFAVAVFGGALGCCLFILRKAVAIYVFIAALIAVIVAQLPFFSMVNFPPAAWIGWFSQLLVSGFLIWYSLQSKSKGWIS